MSDEVVLAAEVPLAMGGMRLDQVAAELFPDFSRSRLQAWIRAGALLADGQARKPKDKLVGGEQLELAAELEEQGDWIAEDVAFELVYEDNEILVVNKPAGLVVHPAAGNPNGTLLNGLLFRWPALSQIPRAGIVHRLDKDTTGLMVVAKTLKAQLSLVDQLQRRDVSRHYQAVVQGDALSSGRVEGNIGRHPRQRQKMAVLEFGGKEAITHYQAIRRFSGFIHMAVKLETGRTHQIRVHMAHKGLPLVGDPLYGRKARFPSVASTDLKRAINDFPRQALHAGRLALVHPESGETMEWQAPLPDDMAELLAVLKSDSEHWDE